MLEGCRIRGVSTPSRDLATDQTITDFTPCLRDPERPASQTPIANNNPKPKTFTLKAGSRVFLDTTSACHESAAFPEPEKVKLDRPLDSYLHYSWGPHQCAGMQASRVMMMAVFKDIVGRKGLRRADGPRGEMKSVPAMIWQGQTGREDSEALAAWSGLRAYMSADQSSYWPVPTTMRIRYEQYAD